MNRSSLGFSGRMGGAHSSGRGFSAAASGTATARSSPGPSGSRPGLFELFDAIAFRFLQGNLGLDAVGFGIEHFQVVHFFQLQSLD